MKSRNDKIEEVIENEVTQVEEPKTEEIKDEKSLIRPKKYVITVNNLALRSGAGKEYEKLGLAEAGITLVTEIKNGYARLADGSGWVSAEYIRKVD